MVRFCYAKGNTFEEMRANAIENSLSQCGDAILVWVNESDFWAIKPVQQTTEARSYSHWGIHGCC